MPARKTWRTFLAQTRVCPQKRCVRVGHGWRGQPWRAAFLTPPYLFGLASQAVLANVSAVRELDANGGRMH